MTQPAYGITIRESMTGARPMIATDFSTIGLVLPRDGASTQMFPADTPVTFSSSDLVYLAGAGTGALKKALAAINNQLAPFQSAARIVAVVVANGANEAETIANIVGDQAAGTGLYALLKAGAMCKVVPRVIACPGYTGQTTTDGQGHTLANPICAALPAVLNKLLGVAVVGGPVDGSVVDCIAWRDTLASDRLIPADAWVVPGSGTGETDGVAEALGLFARVDFQHAGIPGWSISGQQIYGIAGLNTYRSFSLTDGATEGQELLAAQICTIVAGEIAGDTAVDSSGFVWTGVWNSSTDPLLWFYNKRRLKDFVHLALIKSIRKRLGVENVTPAAIKAVENDMVVVGSAVLRAGASIGFKVSFEASSNSAADLGQGKFTLRFANEPPAPITHVTVDSTDYPEALEVELATLIAQAATIPAQYIA